jgi:hypothetical protein
LVERKDALLERARVAVTRSAELRQEIEISIDETYRLLRKFGFTDELLHYPRYRRA